MKKMMAGLALMVGIVAATHENGFAQMTTQETGLTSGMRVQQVLDQSGSSLNNKAVGIYVSTPGTTSGSMSSLSIERFETRDRRLFAVVSLGDLMRVTGMSSGEMASSVSQYISPSGSVYNVYTSPSGTVYYFLSPSGTSRYMDGRYSATYNDSVMLVPGYVNHRGFINIDEGGIADNDGNLIDFGSPGVGDEGRNLIDIDEGGIADNDGNIIDFGAPGHGDDGQAWIDIDEGGIADNDGNIIDFGAPGVHSTGSTTWTTSPSVAYQLRSGALGDTMLASYNSGMLVAVPVSISGASCDQLELNLDVSALTGASMRRDGHNTVMTDRALETKGDLLPVTISTSPMAASSYYSTPLEPASRTTSSMCTVADLVNGNASRLAIVDHLNMLIGAPTSSELTAMR